MSEDEYQSHVGGLYDDEDTSESSLAGRFFLWRWYKRSTRGFGHSRPFFLPLAYLALGMLAFHLGFPALRELVELGLLALHKGLAGMGQSLGLAWDSIMLLHQRRAAAEVLTVLWAGAILVLIIIGSFPPREERDELAGYIVPGSGIIARTWAVIGKRLHMLKRVVAFLVAYIRDLDVRKVHAPFTLVLFLILAFAGLAIAFENLLIEIPIRFPIVHGKTGWIPPTAWMTAAVVVCVLGLPLLQGSLLRAHIKSIDARKRKLGGWFSRKLSGILGLAFISAPLAWMALKLLAGKLT
ncbi:MAG: hypothetical protein JXR96_20660 [Deltaproteobacteria bacterium]|nr:hypothetical protein [Deltaproteobacteria bacterium]